MEHCVKFEGWVGGEKKIHLLNWADVYILPSFNEGLTISILEALSYNCPIISTPVGGIPEVVTEDNGILVEPGNTKQIAEAIHNYVEHPEIVKSHGAISGEIVDYAQTDAAQGAFPLPFRTATDEVVSHDDDAEQQCDEVDEGDHEAHVVTRVALLGEFHQDVARASPEKNENR